MGNPTVWAYEKFDKGMMCLANQSLKSWNWVTGRTKKDLVTGVNLFSTATLSGGSIVAPGVLGIPLAVAYTLIFGVVTLVNRDYCKREEAIEGQDVKDLQLESYKKGLRAYGPFMGLVGGVHLALGADSQGAGLVGSHIMAGGRFGQMFSNYLMRADPVPPRKNVFARAKDGLVKIIEESVLNPEPSLDGLGL